MTAYASRWICALLVVVGILIGPCASSVYATDSPIALEARIKLEIAHENSPRMRIALTRFYSQRAWKLAWQDPELARLARTALDTVQQDGLPAPKYLPLPGSNSPLEIDLLLTVRVLRYAEELTDGATRPAEAADLPKPDSDIAAKLARAMDSPDDLRKFFASLAPDHAAYRALKRAYAQYLRLAAQGRWPQLPSVARIRLSDQSPLAQLVRARLACEDPSLRQADAPLLKEAVKRFQAQAGLSPDGVVGPKTIAALNIEPSQRAAQIAANMERWRWLPHRFPERYIEVNTANATLRAVDHNVVVIDSRVIVGKASTPTPEFDTRALAITINPPWEVPRSIIQKEILPHLRRQPNYLVRNHMVMSNGRVTQMPGADNALGRVKIDILDPFAIYMHDTPAKTLFARDQRHLSHGCIRVQAILPLASWLWTGSVEAGLPRIEAAISEGTTRRIDLKQAVPVYIVYRTAIMRPDGTIGFVPDIYHRDDELITALFGSTSPAVPPNPLSAGGCRVDG
ncbi:MAG: L,D-transpeptidase family protein [Alphaproteobacteria bacterium]|nr:L,D-transpeptidase family protein [Alphaproteobacteria bacterium]